MSNEEDNNVTNEPSLESKKSRRAIFKLLGLLVILGVVGFLTYQHFEKINAISATEKEETQRTITSLDNTTQAQEKTLQSLTGELNQVKQKVEDSSGNLAKNKELFLSAEVRYLVNLADMNVQFRQNAPQAITLLKLADQDIRDLTDLKFLELRKALAADIMDLEAVAKVDTTGIYMRLLALNDKVNQLPLMNKPAAGVIQKPATASDNSLSWWRRGLNQSMDTLRSLVVVRYNQSEKIPLIPPDQQAYLYLNWHTVLMHAMTALMQGESEIYRASLKQAETWITQYSVKDSPISQAFLTELSQLQAIDIHPAMPKISRSLQAVETLTVT